MSKEHIKNEIPFKNEFEQAPLKGDILKLKGNDSALIREWKTQWTLEEFPPGTSLREALMITRGIFGDLSKRYGINVIPFSMTIGKSRKGEDAVFVVTKKISGVDLTNVKTEGPEANAFFRSQLKDMISNLVRYASDQKNAKSGYFLDDIFTEDQYIYGQLLPDSDKLIYLVDVDPQITSVNNKLELKISMEYFLWTIGRLEQMHNIDLNAEKECIENLVSGLEQNGK